MNYYYEVNLNFNDVAYKFYEWSYNDKLEHIKKIPLIKIKSNQFKNIISNNFKVNDDFIKSIEKRTICTKDNEINNACIFCDTKNCIAIEFDDKGKSISRSNLMLEDENNICDISYSLKYKDLDIIKLDKITINNEFRQETKIKKIITQELKDLIKNNDIKKIKYLYYEWFGSFDNNIENIIKNMFDDLKGELKHIHFDIYNIIKLSYNKI